MVDIIRLVTGRIEHAALRFRCSLTRDQFLEGSLFQIGDFCLLVFSKIRVKIVHKGLG